jgi:hypothetical protein
MSKGELESLYAQSAKAPFEAATAIRVRSRSSPLLSGVGCVLGLPQHM